MIRAEKEGLIVAAMPHARIPELKLSCFTFQVYFFILAWREYPVSRQRTWN